MDSGLSSVFLCLLVILKYFYCSVVLTWAPETWEESGHFTDHLGHRLPGSSVCEVGKTGKANRMNDSSRLLPKLFGVGQRETKLYATNKQFKCKRRWQVKYWKEFSPFSPTPRKHDNPGHCFLNLTYKIMCSETSPFCSNLFEGVKVDQCQPSNTASGTGPAAPRVLQASLQLLFLGTNVDSPFPAPLAGLLTVTSLWGSFWVTPGVMCPAEGQVSLWPLGGAVGKGERGIR